ncbi:MAG TPA: sigma-54 dependent transcriptional regulator [Capsulimonadaceae bacterium]|nr:sigma-54 dependent transcriptional regulator [Capsulimonadaceae bacterium]
MRTEKAAGAKRDSVEPAKEVPTAQAGEKHLLIADDEASIRRVLQAIFAKDGYTVHLAENGRKALEVAAQQPISVLITDLIMPDMNGIDLLKKVRDQRPDVVTVMITAYGTIKTAVDAIRLGAADYITKPFDMDEIRAIVARAVARQETASEPLALASSVKAGAPKGAGGKLSTGTPALIEGESPAMQEVFELIRRAAASRATCLIRGESGTGKELVARALHQHSDRASGPFIAVSCAALPETLLESELFGHEKSAFTGAAAQKPGRFELADKGTLFLDEIGDIPHAVQIKLLRVLQERAFERIGGVKTIKVDVRLVAATNADLEELVKEGKFRSDLYYRLHVIQITLPSLRDRQEDIAPLAGEFLRRFAKENGRPELKITDDALHILCHYPWPGNVRELENVMERCVVMADPDASLLTPELLPASVRNNASLK